MFFNFISATTVILGLAVAQNSTQSTSSINPAGPTVNLFIKDIYPTNVGYVADIDTACADQTVYYLKCTNGVARCPDNATRYVFTEGPTSYEAGSLLSGVIAGTSTSITTKETCFLNGTTAAECYRTVIDSSAGSVKTQTASTTIKGSEYDLHRVAVTITSGAEKTLSATAACKKNAAVRIRVKSVAWVGVVGLNAFVGIMGW
jgi:hypothetical protein